MTANDIMDKLGDDGHLVALNAKVTPEMRDLVYSLKKRSGRQVTAIISMALDAFFDGYDPNAKDLPDAEEPGEDPLDEDEDI